MSELTSAPPTTGQDQPRRPGARDAISDAVRGYLNRVRGGDAGVLPVIGGLIILGIIFQSLDSAFLSAANLVNLLIQGSVYMLLGIGVVFVLIVGEIDLSLGYVAGVGAVIAAQLVSGPNAMPWWVACLGAIAATTAIGVLQGLMVALLGLPSFVVTLAGFLTWDGVMLAMLGGVGNQPVNNAVVLGITADTLPTLAAWILLVVLVAVFAYVTITRALRKARAARGALPMAAAIGRIVVIAAVGAVITALSSVNRGALVAITGVPWVVLIVLAWLLITTFLLTRTKPGRYAYAVGGNAESAWRAGINVSAIRISAFAMAGLCAGLAGIIDASWLNSVSTSFDGGQLVLYSIAAAVIGGSSLFGGKGKPLNAVMGGLVIAAVYNGMGLLGIGTAPQYVVTGGVLAAAVTVDALGRRRRRRTSRG